MALTGGLSPLAHSLSTGRLGCPYDMAADTAARSGRHGGGGRRGETKAKAMMSFMTILGSHSPSFLHCPIGYMMSPM